MPTVTVSSRRRNVVSIDSSMQKRITWSPILLTILIVLLFLGGLIYGAVSIPLESVIDILLGKDIGRPAWQNIILQSRFPQAVTALLAGASLVALGTGLFVKPDLILPVKQEIKEYMERYNIEDINSIIGTAVMN